MFSVTSADDTISHGTRSSFSMELASHSVNGQSWMGPFSGFQTLFQSAGEYLTNILLILDVDISILKKLTGIIAIQRLQH